MSTSISNIENTIEVSEKTRNLYDNYDNLLAVVKYDNNKNVDYVLKTRSNLAGKSLEAQKYEQIQVDITTDRPATDITTSSARLRARVYKNNNSKVYEVGFIYWIGNESDSIINRTRFGDQFSDPYVFRGNFSKTITDLQDDVTYYYRAYVRHEYGINYSSVKQFTTISNATIFSIAGDRFSGPAPLTVNLSAINAGFGYSYAWNMTGGQIGFKYPLNSINVNLSGEGYTPLANNFTLQTITISNTGSIYNASDKIIVLVNNVPYPSLSANLGINTATLGYGVTSVTMPTDTLSGFQTGTLNITFSAIPLNSLFFVGLGDGNNSPYTDEALIASSVQALSPAPEFIIHTGDINQEDTEQSFVDNVVPLWANSPLISSIYLAFGNHDLQDGGYGNYILNYLPATRDSLGSTKISNKKYCYDFVKGPCHFFVINTGNNNIQTQGAVGDPFADINGQLDEIIPLINASTARWKIFVCHRPPYTNDELHRPGFFNYSGPFWQNIKSRLNFAALGIDLVLNGHGQQYSVFQKDGVYFVQNGVGGANRRNGIEPYLPETVTVINQKAGYIKYYANFNQLSWEFVDVENNSAVLDSRTITKTSTLSQLASGFGTTTSYTVPRENKILVDGTYQPSLSVVTVQNPLNGLWVVKDILFLSGSIDFFTGGTRTITLSTNGPVTTPAVLSSNSSIAVTNADYFTRTITHTYSSAGNFTPKVFAHIGDQIEKQALRIIRVTGTSDFAPEWQPVLTSPFANNIIAAYDFRNLAGSVELNKYPYTLFDFEPQNRIVPSSIYDRNYLIQTPFLPNFNVGGYSMRLSLAGYIPHGPGGYMGGYDFSGLFGPGITGELGTALRFNPLSTFNPGGYNFSTGGYFAGYSNLDGPRWFNETRHDIFNANNPFSLSMWVNLNEFREPGTRIFSVLPWGYWSTNTEFSISQSTTALKIFKNTYLDETVAGYLQGWEPVAGYFTGFPVLCTTDPSKMLTPNTWNHLVVTRDSQNIYKYYKNSSLMLSAQDVYPLGGYDSFGIAGYGNLGGIYGFGGRRMNPNFGGYASTFSIGENRHVNTRIAPASGLIDTFALWGKALSQDEVDELYNSGTGTDDVGFYKPIVGPKLWVGGMGQMSSSINTFLETDGDSLWDNVTLYAKFDDEVGSSTFADSSINNVTLSSVGGANISNTVKRYGSGSIRFDGIAGYVQTLSSENYGDFGLDDFTIEWWEYIAGYGTNTVGGYFMPIMFYGNPGFGNYGDNILMPEWGIARAELAGYGRGHALRFYSRGISGFDKFIQFQDNFFTAGGGFTLSAWTHNALQRRRRSNSNIADFSWYKNGALAGYSTTSLFEINANLAGYGTRTGIIGAAAIGGYNTTPEFSYTDGYIDEIRISKGVSRYTTNFTPPTTSYQTDVGEYVGTRFRPVDQPGSGGSFAVAREAVTFTYPHTVAFIGNANITTLNRTIFQNLQTTYSQNVNISLDGYTERALYHRGSIFNGGLSPSNSNGIGVGTPVLSPVGGYMITQNYIPAGNEWFYISYSFLGPNNDNQIRYYLQSPSMSGEGVLAGYFAPSFNGIPGFGLGGYSLAPYFGSNDSVERPTNTINGVARLGVYINQGFNSHSDMVSLYKTITAGPANNIILQ